MPANPAFRRECVFTDAQEDRIREIMQEEIAAYFEARQDMAITIDPPRTGEALLREIEDAARARYYVGGHSYRDYLRERDEPPAAPPVRPVPNTTEPL